MESARGTVAYTLDEPGSDEPVAFRWDGVDLIPVYVHLGSEFTP